MCAAKSSKEAIEKTLEKMGDEHPPEVQEKIRKLTEEIYTEGQTPSDAMGIKPEMVEGMYSFAYRLYTLGKYDQASQMFRLLIMMNPMEMRFLLGVSACYHMQKYYDHASTSYMLCSLIDPSDPVPYYHASDCFIELENYIMAKKSLKLCIAHCGDKEDYQVMKDRAEVSLKGVLEKIKFYEKELAEIEKKKKQAKAKKAKDSKKPPAEPPQTEAKKSA